MQLARLASPAYTAPRSAANKPSQSPAPNPQPEPGPSREERVAAFYDGVSGTAKWQSRIDGAMLGGTVGLTLTPVLALACGAGAGLAAFSGLAGGAALGYGGYRGFDNLSSFAGKLGADLDKGNTQRGDALGRAAVNSGIELISGNWKGALVDAGVAFGGGVLSYGLAG